MSTSSSLTAAKSFYRVIDGSLAINTGEQTNRNGTHLETKGTLIPWVLVFPHAFIARAEVAIRIILSQFSEAMA